MPGARGQHDHVARPRGDDDPVVAAELHRHLAAVDAECLVRIAVKVMKRIDAIAPRCRPAIAVEQFSNAAAGSVPVWHTAPGYMSSGQRG